MAFISICSQIVKSHDQGTFERCLTMTVSNFEFLMANLVAQVPVLIVHVTSIFIVTFVVAENTLLGSWMDVYALFLLSGFMGMFLGAVIAVFGKTETTMMALSLGLFFTLTFLCSIIWPIEGSPKLLQHISSLLPLTHPTSSLRSMLYRGWTLWHPQVSGGLFTLIIWIVVCCILLAFAC